MAARTPRTPSRAAISHTTPMTTTKAATLKPTEAQLRWAQFHLHKQAVQVRQQIDTLWETPRTVDQVEGACSDDGNTTVSSNASGDVARRRPKPIISRGRRALLRVSKRRLKERKDGIIKNGYRMSEYDSGDEDALDAIFEGTTFKRRKRNRQTERSRRFEEAFLRMMERLAASHPQTIEIETPERIWTRPDGLPDVDLDYVKLGAGRSAIKNPTPAASFSPMDRGASWMLHIPGVAQRTNQSSSYLPFPTGDEDCDSEDDRQSQISNTLRKIVGSPVSNKCSSIVAALQQHMQESDEKVPLRRPPMMKLASFHPQEEKKIDDSCKQLDLDFANVDTPKIKNRVQMFKQSQSPSRQTVNAILTSLDQDLINELESLEPGISEQLLERFLDEVGFDPREDEIETAKAYLEVFARRYLVEARYFPEKRESTKTSRHPKHGGLVQRFIAKVEESCEMEALVSADGKLHKPTFARMVQRYLDDVETGRSPPTSPGRRQLQAESVRDTRWFPSETTDVPRHRPGSTNQTGSVVSRMLANIDAQSPQESLTDGEGKLDIVRFEGLVAKYLVEASGMDERSVLSADDLASLSAPRKEPSNLVERLVSRIESHGSELVEDGKLDVDYFQEMMRGLVEHECRKQWKAKGRMGGTLKIPSVFLEKGGHHNASFSRKQSETAFFNDSVEAARSEIARVAQESIVSGRKVDQTLLKDLVSRYLAAACCVPQTIISRADRIQGGVHAEGPEIPQAFMKRFVQQLGQAVEVEGTVCCRDGKLDRSRFERLVNVYLCEPTDMSDEDDQGYFSSAKSPFALARARKSSVISKSVDGKQGLPECQVQISDAVVSKFVDDIEREVAKGRQLFDERGRIDKKHLLSMTEAFLPTAFLAGSKSNMSKRRYPRLGTEEFVKRLVPTMMECSEGTVLRKTKEGEVDIANLASVVEESILKVYVGDARAEGVLKQHAHAASSRIVKSLVRNSIDQEFIDSNGKIDEPLCKALIWRFIEEDAESQNRSLPVREVGLGGRRSDPAEVSRTTGKGQENERNFVEGGLHRMGGFIKSMYNGSNEGDDESTKTNQQELLAAFRQSRKGKAPDDTSSISSFRALPEGVKNVVRNLTVPRESLSLEENKMLSDNSSFASSGHGQLNISSGTAKSEGVGVKFLTALVDEKEERSQSQVIDSDGNVSDTSGGMVKSPDAIARLLLSPTLLSKRLQQAVRAVEDRKWEQATYLLNANPWLAEMLEINSQRYILHKVALFGASEGETNSGAPASLNIDLVRMFPSAVQKFDSDGNLPLHMACASANLTMVRLLGDRFPGGASVRNEEGMLPLHLAILACLSEDSSGALDLVQCILGYFPAAVAVADNEGNLPIHTASGSLRGASGAAVIHVLLEEAERFNLKEGGTRFRNRIKQAEAIDPLLGALTVHSDSTTPTEISSGLEDVEHCSLVRNEDEDTPLLLAAKANSGWEVIEALIYGPGGKEAIKQRDLGRRTPLILLLDHLYHDPAGALSILKISPEAAFDLDDNGTSPIEIAARNRVPPEVMLALVMVDLPFQFTNSDYVVPVREDKGKSWWYIACHCDDKYAGVVEEVLRVCSYPQVRQLCFMERSAYSEPLIHHASPRCRKMLQKSLRFVGRYEFQGQGSVFEDKASGIQVFEALDYGAPSNPFDEGLPVFLRCYTNRPSFLAQRPTIDAAELDFDLLERWDLSFVDRDGERSTEDDAMQYCVAVERPNLTLGGVVVGMLGNEDCKSIYEVREKYAVKVFSVLRLMAKAVSYLHERNICHGSLCLDNCAKYEGRWKLAGASQACKTGDSVQTKALFRACPPELVHICKEDKLPGVREVAAVSMAHDVWAFGVLAYEALVGEKPVPYDLDQGLENDSGALATLMTWNERDLARARSSLLAVGVLDSGADMVLSCLSPDPELRPRMVEMLKHKLWSDLRQLYKKTRGEL